MVDRSYRCEAHNLVVGPDDLCVVCRRERGRPAGVPPKDAARPAFSPMRIVAGVLGVGLLATVVGAVVLLASGGQDAPAMPPGRGIARSQQPMHDPMQAPTEAPASPAEDAAFRRARAEVRVELYSTSWCPHCTEARDYLRSEGITFVEFDVETDGNAKARFEVIHPSGSIPFLVVDGSATFEGFSPGSYGALIDRAARDRLL